MKINGTLFAQLEDLGALLGLPDGIIVEAVSCDFDDVAGGIFKIYVHKSGAREQMLLENPPYLVDVIDEMRRTDAVRCRVAQATDELARLVDEIERVGYECKGEPLEGDPNFKRLAEIVEAKV